MANPIDGFSVDPAELNYIGQDLQRPECILAERDGSLWVADARGGVVHIQPDGSQRIITQSVAGDFADASDEAKRFTEGTLPNGLAFAENGDILISNFGTDLLEVMTREGETRTLYDRIDGQPIGKVNFVLRDSKNRIWITVSTRVKNWMDAAISRIKDGYVALVDERGIRIVADGFAFTNEIRLDAAEEWLYVVETTGRRVTRLRVAPDGELSQRETYGPEDTGGLHRRHRLRCLRQPLGHPHPARPAVRHHARGRSADYSRRHQSGASRGLFRGFRGRPRRRPSTCWPAAAAWPPGWPASPSAAPTSAPPTSAACGARGFPIFARPWAACRRFTGR